jgi:hypothetical protein
LRRGIPLAIVRAMPRIPRGALLLVLPLLLLGGCTFHSVATRWHGRTGIDGQRVFAVTTTTYGFNLLVVIPFLGDARSASLVDECTARIAEAGGDRLRLVETESANYWYALPPLSWFVAPVMGSVSIEYAPSAEELAAVAAEEAEDAR